MDVVAFESVLDLGEALVAEVASDFVGLEEGGLVITIGGDAGVAALVVGGTVVEFEGEGACSNESKLPSFEGFSADEASFHGFNFTVGGLWGNILQCESLEMEIISSNEAGCHSNTDSG